MARILIIDDEQSILNVLSVVLKTENYEVVAECRGEQAQELIKNEDFDLMLSDIRMSPINGMQLLKLVHDIKPHMPVIMLTAFSSMETATEALKLGAFDYILKPFKVDELLSTIAKALDAASNNSMGGKPVSVPTEIRCYLDNIIAESGAMREICELIKKIAPVDTPVFIVGERGTGKQNVARVLHSCSHRKEGPFVSINCAELPEPLLDSALFGHIKNAFDGADHDQEGLLESANSGTILLSEVGEMPLSIQAKFVLALQRKEVTRIGSKSPVSINIRVISSSNVRLEQLTREGKFREDLYNRLCVIPMEIKPLRTRLEDIIPLSYYFLKVTSDGAAAPNLDNETCDILESYAWPGNCRELRDAMKHASQKAKDGLVTKDCLPQEIASTPVKSRKTAAISDDSGRGKSLKAFLTHKKSEYLKQVMNHSDGKKNNP